MMRRRRFLGVSLAVVFIFWRKSSTQQPWRLGIVGRGELGVNTYLGSTFRLLFPIIFKF